MEDFIRKQQEVYPISKEEIEVLLQNLTEVRYKKGEIVSREGQRESYVYFVKNGLLRSYVVRDGKDVTLWFAGDGEMAVSVSKKISGMDVEVLEDSVLLRIAQPKLEELFSRSLELANWGRKLLERYLDEYEHYFTAYSWTDAREQYEMLIRSNPVLMQRVPLKYIASYLQITPQSLSRIRARK